MALWRFRRPSPLPLPSVASRTPPTAPPPTVAPSTPPAVPTAPRAAPPRAPRRPVGLVRELPLDSTAAPAPEPPDPSPTPISDPPDLDELAAAQAPAPPVRLAGRFATAAAALTFTGQLDCSGHAREVGFGRSTGARHWWVFAECSLPTAREQIAVANGDVFVEVDGRLVSDPGWGDQPQAGPVAAQASPDDDIIDVGLTTLVRVAGLSPVDLPAPEALDVLVPADRLGSLIARALDLRLAVSYRPVGLQPLFVNAVGTHAPHPAVVAGTPEKIMFDVRLQARPVGGAATSRWPSSLLTALDRDPTVLVCRPVGDRLLIQHPRASPLPDSQLGRLAAADTAGGVWVLAGAGYSCSRLLYRGEPHDGASMVRLDDTYELIDLDCDSARSPDEASAPLARTLQVVATRTHGVEVDAALLDDADLACLGALLEGQPLADIALLVRGRDRHLLLAPDPGGDRHLLVAPGGLLERLPVGEPLYCVGPGLLYLPIGYRTQPLLPPSARAVLFPLDADTAIVVRPDAALVFSLTNPEPVWTLWAGPPPPLDHQLPATARAALDEVDALVDAPSPAATSTDRPDLPRTVPDRPVEPAPSWRHDAFTWERAGALIEAAQLHERNGDLLRAAHLYERAARDGTTARPGP